MNKKFELSKDDVWIAGICGGIAKYTNTDSLLIRILFLTIMFGTAFPIGFMYLLIWILAPTEE